MPEVNINLDVDHVLSSIDNDDLVSHLEDQGYCIVEESITGNQSINTMEEDQIINAICDKFGEPYTISKSEVLELFKERVLKL